MINNLGQILEALLKSDSRLVSQEGELLKNRVQELVAVDDEQLLESLFSTLETRDHFFVTLKKVVVFEKEKFLQFILAKEWLPDSYTSYKNRVGLASASGLPVGAGGEVVLEWAFKDCVLEGGMDGTEQTRQEVFFNETLAPDQINRLLEAKAFTNMKRFTAKGEQPLTEFNVNEHGVPTDNLLIRGNNLLGLSSLVDVYAGKVKLIYIDPPYNTRGTDDSFRYNDAFNHSTWLTFMKNRLELAKRLLAPDGAIYVQLDYNEVHYCKVLMDEIFGRANFQREIIWRIGWVSGYKTIEKNWIRNHDSILFYAKDATRMDFIKKYIKYPKDYLRRDGSKPDGEGYAIEDTWNSYGIDSLSDYANDSMDSIAIISFSKEKVGNFKGQKNEALVKRIIEAHTQEGDLVLDFFSGTGTTAAVAHKMNRRWIVIEQIASQIEIAEKRLGGVIAGDAYGISKDVAWTGGGEFVSLELAERNPKLSKEIAGATDVKQLTSIFDQLVNSPYLSHKIDLIRLKEGKSEFESLNLEQAKSALVEMLDKNAFYINISEVDDKTTNLKANEISLSKSFYGLNK
jgi:adenine-specific DNA-methyltransferase